MCKLEQHIVLVETVQAHISWCKGCKNYSFIFKSCCLAFTKYEIEAFQKGLKLLRDEDFHYNFCDQRHALLKNQSTPFGIALTQEEAKQAAIAIEQAINMKEVFEVIYD